MRRQWKFHAMAVLIICGVILLIYAYMESIKPAPIQAAPGSSNSVHIISASWGLNCKNYVTQENQKRLKLKLRPQDIELLHPDDRPASLEQLPAVVTDNVLIAVGELCNGKPKCQFVASSTVLKNEPHSACFKHFAVKYRCFEFDRLWSTNAGQGDTITIDCNETKPAASAQ